MYFPISHTYEQTATIGTTTVTLSGDVECRADIQPDQDAEDGWNVVGFEIQGDDGAWREVPHDHDLASALLVIAEVNADEITSEFVASLEADALRQYRRVVA